MAVQLTFDFSSKAPLDDHSLITKDTWLDVSEIALGVGFIAAVQASLALHEALQHQRDDYDQLLYDALWLAHLKLSLDHWQSVTFNFSFPNIDPQREEPATVSLRLRAELKEQVVMLGLL